MPAEAAAQEEAERLAAEAAAELQAHEGWVLGHGRYREDGDGCSDRA